MQVSNVYLNEQLFENFERTIVHDDNKEFQQ